MAGRILAAMTVLFSGAVIAVAVISYKGAKIKCLSDSSNRWAYGQCYGDVPTAKAAVSR
jgi:hypothetical protein